MNPQLGITPMMLRCTGQVGYWSSCIMRVTVLALNVPPPTFFDEQLGSAVGAIDYVRGSGN